MKRLLLLIPLLAFFVLNLPAHRSESLNAPEQAQLTSTTIWQSVLLGQANSDLKHQRTTEWVLFTIVAPQSHTPLRFSAENVSPAFVSRPLSFHQSLQARAPPSLLS